MLGKKTYMMLTGYVVAKFLRKKKSIDGIFSSNMWGMDEGHDLVPSRAYLFIMITSEVR